MIKACENNYIHYYDDMADAMMSKSRPSYRRFRCVTPAWDNWARRKRNAAIFLDANPQKYKTWLTRIIADTNTRLHGEERVVFINAWNEWAEGCHLEPDQKFGHAYLEATRQALEDNRRLTARKPVRFSQARLNQLADQIMDYHQQLEEQHVRISRRDEKIEELLQSTSWRLTVPVRRIKQYWLDIKDRFTG